MSRRVFILGAILLIRMFAGGLATRAGDNGQIIKVTGNIDKITHTVSKDSNWESQRQWTTTIRVGQFLATKAGWKDFDIGQRVQVVGRKQQDLLGFWLGSLWLSEAKIDELPTSLSTTDCFWIALQNARMWLVEKVSRLVPSPEAELISGMVLGAKSTLPADFKEALVRTGTIHTVVASGFNVTLVGTIMVSILILVLPRFKANWVAILCVWGYVLLTGAQAPVVRAAVMFSVVTMAGNLGLPILTGWVLAVTIWSMLLFDPRLLVDTSFQLTVMATSGLVWLAPKLERVIRLPGELIPTLAAQIATAPVIFLQFGQISLIAPLVNLLVLPLVAPLTIGGSLLVLTASFSGYISLPFVWFCYGLSHLFVLIITGFSQLGI